MPTAISYGPIRGGRLCVVSSYICSFSTVPESPGVASQQRNLWEIGMAENVHSSRRRRLFFEEGEGYEWNGRVYKSCKGGWGVGAYAHVKPKLGWSSNALIPLMIVPLTKRMRERLAASLKSGTLQGTRPAGRCYNNQTLLDFIPADNGYSNRFADEEHAVDQTDQGDCFNNDHTQRAHVFGTKHIMY